MAVAASILTAIHYMLKDGTTYQDLGPHHFDRRFEAQHTRHLVRRPADLGPGDLSCSRTLANSSRFYVSAGRQLRLARALEHLMPPGIGTLPPRAFRAARPRTRAALKAALV